MKEKFIIKSECYNVKKFFKIMMIIGIIISVIYLFIAILVRADADRLMVDILASLVMGFLPFSLIGVLIYLWLRSYELIVTDKRIYGRVAWGKRVDLPLDSVSATATTTLKGVSVSTSSGRISFRLIKNADAIYQTINGLLIARQQGKLNSAATSSPAGDAVDQLKKYKDLLDSGVITQEEFDAKKKQLLDL